MNEKSVSFEELQRDKRRARARDEQRLARGEVTPVQLPVIVGGHAVGLWGRYYLAIR